MKTKIISETLYKKELSKMSSEELEQYLVNIRKDIKDIEFETARLKKQIQVDKIKNAELREELKVWKEINAKQIKKLGWEDLTNDELKWIEQNYKKEWPIFKPSVRNIKQKYAEKTGKPEDKSLDIKYASSPEMKQKSGWIDRKGIYYPVGFAEHGEWAWKYLNKKYGFIKAKEKVSETKFKEPHAYLEEAGWVRIMAWPKVNINFILPSNLTQRQKQTLYKYCQLHKEPLPFNDPLFK